MAYNTSTDYKALQDSLKKQMEAATDEATKANLQAQINAADQSRIEKIASNLNTYGKYANDSELDSAAGIQATNQIGTGYETQKSNLNKSYDQAIRNASNNALSRGMARSSFVQDRMANLDSERANALSGVDAAKALAIQNAKTAILGNYQDRAADTLATEKKDFGNNIMAYYNDYQAKINDVTNDGDTSNDWQIPILQAARNQKLLDTYGTTNEAAIAAAKNAATGTKYTGGGGTSSTTDNTRSTANLATLQTGLGRINKTVGYAGVVKAIDGWLASGKITESDAEQLISSYVQ